jgi:hypothetical protein
MMMMMAVVIIIIKAQTSARVTRGLSYESDDDNLRGGEPLNGRHRCEPHEFERVAFSASREAPTSRTSNFQIIPVGPAARVVWGPLASHSASTRLAATNKQV